MDVVNTREASEEYPVYVLEMPDHLKGNTQRYDPSPFANAYDHTQLDKKRKLLNAHSEGIFI